jgi:hypothetical protein
LGSIHPGRERNELNLSSSSSLLSSGSEGPVCYPGRFDY